MTAVHIIVGGIVGFLLAAIAGVFFTIWSGGIEQGQGDPREYVVSAMLAIGLIAGCVVGWWLT